MTAIRFDRLSETEPPWQHQLDAVSRAKILDSFALFFKPGAGKTRTAIRILINKMHAKNKTLKTLIFTPQAVCQQLRREWFKYTDIKPEKVVVLLGSQKKRCQDFLYAIENGSFIFITNYESLNMPDLFRLLCMWESEAQIWDESQNIKDPKTKRSKQADLIANPHGKPQPHKQILSGTPVLNSPMDIFQQFKILDGGQSFGHNFWQFQGRYFIDRCAVARAMGRTQKRDFQLKNIKQDGFDAEKEIKEIISKKAMYADVDKFLPPEAYITIQCPMTPEQKKAYLSMKNDLVAEVNSGICSVNMAMTKALRLMQIASGFVAIDNDPEQEQQNIKHRFEATPKIEQLRELLEQISQAKQKVLVWAVWRENYEQIKKVCNDLKLKYVEVHGDISPKNKEKAIQDFTNNPDFCVYIGHPRSGGIGLNLVSAAYSIFYSRTFSLEHFEQAKRRNFRGGQTKPVTHYLLSCEETIDQDVVRALTEKQVISDKLIKEMLVRSGANGP